MNQLYPNCIPVMGFVNIALCDLDRQCFYMFPKAEFFKRQNNENRIYTCQQELSEKAIFFLKEKQLLLSDKATIEDKGIQASYFYKWKSPSLITNAIIILHDENELLKPANFNRLMNCLEKLLCKHVCFFIKSYTDLDNLKQLLSRLQNSTIHSLQLFLLYQEEFYTDEFGSLILSQPFIQFVVLEESPFEKNIENKIFFMKNKLESHSNKKEAQFVTNTLLFSESQLHHTYFNRKLFIDATGQIKNAPECKEGIGRIQDVRHPEQLIEWIQKPAFQKYWYITKERCEICRDCEFKHICVDNRLPYQQETGYWYHKEKCNYDPYTGKWKEE